MLKKLFRQKEDDRMRAVTGESPNDLTEQQLATFISSDISEAESAKLNPPDDLGWSLETVWEDEEKIYKGGGLQWCTEFAYRSKRMRKIRPNSEDNFIFNAIQIMHANVTANIPQPKIVGTKNSHEVQAHKVQCASRYNDEKNHFDMLWRRTVLDFLKHGPAIMKVSWDSEIYGGRGPDRWIGDVSIKQVKKEDFFPDSSIQDLELNMGDCNYVIQRFRMKLSYIRDRWKNHGDHVGANANDGATLFEGNIPDTAHVYEYWHRGYPEYMPKDRKKELEQRAVELEQIGHVYKSKDVMDMAKSEIEGVHVAYYSDGVLLEYIPYYYDHGKYPFSYTTRYDDDTCQWGFGEIRNIKIPQVLHNKADEVEMEAMSRQGLGGFYYRKGALSPKQLDRIKEDGGKGAMAFEVNDPNGIKEREGVQVPSNIPNYKEHKQRMIDVVSQVTETMQGRQSHSGMPYKSVAELGQRGDTRVNSASEKLKYLLKDVNLLRIELFDQFYTEERYYRLKGPDGEIIEDGTFSNQMMYDVWQRETIEDEMGNKINLEEHFVPDFDIEVDIISKKPTDRNFYANIAFTMHDRQAITKEDLWKTVDEGRLPDLDIVMQHLHAQDSIQSLIAALGDLPEDIQQDLMQTKMAELQELVMETKRLLAEQEMLQKGEDRGGVKNPQNQTNKPQQQPKPREFADNLDYSGGLVGGQNFDTITGR